MYTLLLAVENELYDKVRALITVLPSSWCMRRARSITHCHLTVHGLPKPDFSFSYKPSLITLFRFSALTFNGHYIHLDKDYAQNSEGYPGLYFGSQASVCIYHVFQTERLVHGPLTALMLLEALLFHRPGLQLQSFSYRARNPLIVNRTCTIYGSFSEEDQIDVWCEDIDGVVGMTGRVNFASQGAL